MNHEEGGSVELPNAMGWRLDVSKRSPAWGPCLAFVLAACHSAPEYVEPKLNPHPKQGYEITMTFADAPGPFASMLGLAQYDIVTQKCLSPPDDNPGGYSMNLSHDVEFSLTRVSDVEYKGTVYVDGLLDEEYYGRGVCHWQLIQARVHLKATGAPGETLFNASISARPLMAEHARTIYYWTGGYPRSSVEDYPDSGESGRVKFKPELQDHLFAITITSRKKVP